MKFKSSAQRKAVMAKLKSFTKKNVSDFSRQMAGKGITVTKNESNKFEKLLMKVVKKKLQN